MTPDEAVSQEKRRAKDSPSDRMIQSIDTEALIKQAAAVSKQLELLEHLQRLEQASFFKY